MHGVHIINKIKVAILDSCNVAAWNQTALRKPTRAPQVQLISRQRAVCAYTTGAVVGRANAWVLRVMEFGKSKCLGSKFDLKFARVGYVDVILAALSPLLPQTMECRRRKVLASSY
jgi:hypothetical protein